jgi:hypothetical protein
MADTATLGQITGNGFDQDLALSDRYLAFSAELLRLALLAIGALGYLLNTPAFLQASDSAKHDVGVRRMLLAVAILMGLSAASALAHRYIVSDMLACQLRLVRLRTRNLDGDRTKANDEAAARNWRLSAAGPLLVLSTISLLSGAVMFVISLFVMS